MGGGGEWGLFQRDAEIGATVYGSPCPIQSGALKDTLCHSNIYFAFKWDVFNEITHLEKPKKNKNRCSCFLTGARAVLMKGPAGMKRNMKCEFSAR